MNELKTMLDANDGKDEDRMFVGRRKENCEKWATERGRFYRDGRGERTNG